MQRREFIAGLGIATAWPVVARAQQGERVRRVGVLFGGAETELDRDYVAAFLAGLKSWGGRGVLIFAATCAGGQAT
jgi:hypothetical protein